MLAASLIRVLIERGTTKFSGPYNERVFQHAARFQIFQKSRNRLVNVTREVDMGFDIEMRVPVLVDVRTAVDQFDEANAALSEATSYQALPGETLRGPPFQTVEVVCGIGFFRQIEGLGRFLLHAESRFKRFHAADERGVRLASNQVFP